ncbi:hypothetical protein [Amycolatopsis sp. 195334CR]|uniref:hypothetical protein n=1 Tax=Amycolatopsis sp. 195334CR TaxID=2814588 RepID=UPI001A8EF0B4|nr:hypothetical protein [Amycolatopsis sp. 195334CR]MBN6040991.1 hypothetical protein [Amycolatopsis sp. 195334CR]
MTGHQRGRRVLLLCALVFAVLGMHHLTATAHAAAPMVHSAPAEHSPEAPAHELGHQCPAILHWLGVGLIALALLWFRPLPAVPRPAGRRLTWPEWRPPDRSGRLLLTALCVHRQ